MKKTRIMYVNLTSELGGSDISLFTLVSGLDRTKFDPVVVLPRQGPFDSRYASMGVAVHHVPMAKLARGINPSRYLKFFLLFLPSVFIIAALIIRLRVQLVHVNSMVNLCPAFSAWLTGRPLIWHARERPLKPELVEKLLKAIMLLLANKIIATSEFVRSMFPRSNRVHLVYNAVDTKRFNPGSSDSEKEKKIIIGSVGRITELKQYEILLQAVPIVRRKFPDINLWIIGWAPPRHEKYLSYLKELAGELGILNRTVFWGAREDVPQLLQSFYVYVHTASHREAFGRTIVEAMAVQKPVVASAAGGALEIVKDGITGFLVPPEKPQALAERLIALLEDRELASRMGIAGRKRVIELFGVEAHVANICNIYFEISKMAGLL